MTGRPPPAPPVRRAGAAARAKITDAAIRCLVRDGVSSASMGAIAAEAGVSKALLHYHYADRTWLLAEVIAQLGDRIVSRERAAMEGATGSGAVDVLWRWLAGELARGELRVLLELGMLREPELRAASDAAALTRRRAAARTAAQLFERLALTPRVPVALLGDASVAFIDGLAAASARSAVDPRVGFDVFWLALLSLAE